MTFIELRLFAGLAAKAPDDTLEVPIEPGISVAQLLNRLRLSPEEAKLIFINGVRSDLDGILMGGERVGIFPPIGGG